MLNSRVGPDDGLIPFPVSVEALQFSASDFMARVICKGRPDRFHPSAPDIGREAILGAALDADSSKAGVIEPVSRLVYAHSHIVRIGRVQRRFCPDIQFAFGLLDSFRI